MGVEKMKVKDARGVTIAEMIISMAIILMVLGLATALFKQAFTHNTMTAENMSNEQLARETMAKLNSSIAQASEDTNSGDETSFGASGQPILPVIPPAPPQATATPLIVFYRVGSLALPMPVGSQNEPDPTYNVHIISYDAPNQQIKEYVMTPTQYFANAASPAPTILGRNVTDFQVQQVPANLNEFRLSVTVSKSDPTKPEAPFTLVDNVHIIK
jgi:hypothetical protein